MLKYIRPLSDQSLILMIEGWKEKKMFLKSSTVVKVKFIVLKSYTVCDPRMEVSMK